MKNQITRRRGTTIAAAALSIALVAPFAQPVAFAQEHTAATADQAPGAPAVDENGVIDADMIASGRVTKAANLTDAHGVGKGLISGHVYLTSPNGNPGAAYDNGNVKLDDITVYAQFRDKDGSYSPIFSAKTHTLPDVVGGNGGQGTFAFGTGDKGITWTDSNDVEHSWSARTDQQHRIWVEPFTNERGNRVEMFRQANGWTPGSFNGVVEGPMGSFVAADGNMQLMAAFLREVAPNHETSWMAAKDDRLVEDPEGPIGAASVQQNVPNTISGEVWLETGGSPDWGFPATGPKRESKDPAADGYTVYASTLTKDGAAANEALHKKFKNDPDKLAEETKKMLEANPEYILKTVYGKTNNKGEYTLRFGNYEKGQVREDILNRDHIFMWVENKDGVVQNGYTGFHTPVFQHFGAGGNFKPNPIPAENQVLTNFNGVPFQELNSLYNVHHAVMPYAPVSITADYNATDKPAAPGTTVTPEFSGELSDLPSKIEWRDKNGKVVKTCELDQTKTAKDQVAACTFDIPAEAEKGDVYNVVVVSGNNDVAAWSVLVTDKAAEEFEPGYEDGSGKPGDDVTVPAPEFRDKDGNPTEAPDGTKFTPGEDAPEGVKVDENTGEITVPVPEDAKPGDKITVPVEVTYPDGSKDNVDVTVTVEEPDAPDTKQKDEFEPGYEDGSGKPGDDVTVPAPEFKDKDGNPTEAPDGTKFTPGDNAPDGVKVDEKTGEITVPVPEDAKPGDKVTVPVEVTYPDGSKDNVDVTVTVEQPDAPETPADKDADKFEPGFEDGSGKPGGDVKVEKPEFKDKDGNPTEAPEDTTFKPGDKAPDGVKVDENTGEITVPVPEDAKPGDKITVPVEVTYPDGSKDNVDVTVTVEEPDAPAPTPGDDKTEVDSSGKKPVDPTDEKQGSGVKVINPDNDTKVSAKDEDGKDVPAVINPETGEIELTPGKDVDGPITVVVEDPDLPNGKAEIEIEVEGHEKGRDDNDKTTTASEEDPNYGDAVVVKPGESKDSKKPFGEKDVPADTTITVKVPENATGWEFTNDADGVITGQAPSNEELAKQFAELGEKDWSKVVEALTPVAEPSVDVEFEYADGSKDNADAKFKLVGQDGKSILDPEGDADGDGVSNKEEVEKGYNPFDKNSKPAPAPQGPADTGKCIASAVGFGLPLLALIPIGLATQLTIPGLTDFVENVSMDIERANAQIQKNLGMFNPQTAQAMSQMNAQLRKAGLDLATVGAGLAVIAAGIIAGTIIYDNCAPGDAKSSVKVDSLKGSSGKTWTSSKKDEK